MKTIKPRIFYFSFTLSPRWICKVVLHKLSGEDFYSLPNNYLHAFGQGTTQQEAYDNWLLDLTNEKYK